MSKTKPKQQKGGIGEFVKVVVFALVIAYILRSFLFQSFHIPSGSMEPTLYKGDYIITTKYSLGYGKYAASPLTLPIKKGRYFERKPKRGDVIVFKPVGSKVHFIKRLVGLPGDEIQMKSGFLYINGTRQKTEKLAAYTQSDRAGNPVRAQKYREFFDGQRKPHLIKDLETGGRVDDTGIYTVPGGHYFFMGDNRDNSRDSRFPIDQGGVSYVPASHLVGRAEFVLLSAGQGFTLYKPWTWGNLRGDRFFKGLR